MTPIISRLMDRVAWNSGSGVVLYSLLAFAVASYLMRLAGTPSAVQYVTGATCAAGFIAAWGRQRRLPKFKANQIGILVSFRCSGTLAEQNKVHAALDALVDLLHSNAQSREIAPLTIVVKKLPANVHVPDAATARRIATKTGSVCMIWCQGTAGSRAGEPTIDLGRVAVLVRHKELPTSSATTFRSHLQLVHSADRRYQVSLRNDVVELPLVSNHLTAISKYQIGLAFAVSGFRDAAITLLTESLELDAEELPHKRLARRVISALRIAPWASQLPLPGDTQEETEAALREAEVAIREDPRNSPAYSVLISARFLLGDIKGAMAANGIMKDFLREQLPSAFLLNQAVFRLSRHQFDSALTSYRQAGKLGIPYQTAGAAILWLERATETLSPAYAFGAAILNDEYYDPSRAVEGYEACLKLLPAGSKARAHADERLEALRGDVGAA